MYKKKPMPIRHSQFRRWPTGKFPGISVGQSVPDTGNLNVLNVNNENSVNGQKLRFYRNVSKCDH